MLRTDRAEVETVRGGLNQRRFCRFLGVSSRSYHRSFSGEARSQSRKEVAGHRVLSDAQRERLKELAKEHEIYGYRKVWALAQREDVEVGDTTVYRVLREAGLTLPRDYAKRAKRRAKQLRPHRPQRINEEWQTDIMELVIADFGTHYFMAIEDIFSRYILAWTLSPTQTAEVAAELLEQAWEEALRLCGPIEEPIRVRTDNGGQYRSQVWQDYLEAEEERFEHERTAYRSPEEIGYIESFHGKLRVEEIYQRDYRDPVEALRSIGSWVTDYNHYRPHQGLDYRVPAKVYLEGVAELKLRRQADAN